MMCQTAVEQAIILLADGVRPDVMQNLLDAGELPGLEDIFFRNRENVIDTGVTVFPSTTGPAHLPFLTGFFPGTCNIPGIRWFDPEAFQSRFFSPYRFRSYMGLGNYFLGRDMNLEIRTIFQEIGDHRVIAGNIRRGVRWGRNMTRTSKLLHNIRSFVVQDWRGLDHKAEQKLLEAVTLRTPLIFAAFYGADSNGHKEGPYGDRALACYRRLDRALARLGMALRKTRCEEKTLICLVSDHGMSETCHHIDLQSIVHNLCGPCLAHPKIWEGYFSARSAVMVSGNSMAHLYFRGEDNWRNRYVDRPGKEMSGVLQALLKTTGIDQVAGRFADGAIQVHTLKGSALIRELRSGKIEYSSLGEDPFGYPQSFCGCFTDRELLESTFQTAYPDAPRQLLQLFRSPRCGHLVVTAAPGYDLRARYERPTHRGSHGSLHREHMVVPLLLNRPVREGVRRTVDLFPTVMEALGKKSRVPTDGISLFSRAIL